MKESNRLRLRLWSAMGLLLLALLVALGTTLAWYIFTVKAHTTKLKMAAGAGASLEIAKEENGEFSSSVSLEDHKGVLFPVSTDRIQNGFQRADDFTTNDNNLRVANIFKKIEEQSEDYIRLSLYLRTNSTELDVYVADIGFTDSDDQNPISSAIRVGFVIPSTGDETIFAISDAKNPQKQYNTATGSEGCVLDSTKTDGSTVRFEPKTKENYCEYDKTTGTAKKKDGAVRLCTVKGGEKDYGAPVEVQVYIWLEGCDEDCIENIGTSTLEDLSLSFAGLSAETAEQQAG